jgi:hypothetical protein
MLGQGSTQGGFPWGEAVAAAAGIIGTVVGVLLDRYLQSRGRVKCFASEWSLTCHRTGDLGLDKMVSPEEVEYARYMFSLDFFNSKDEPTGFRDLRVQFYREGSLILSQVPEDVSASYVVAMQQRFQSVATINLPPKQWVHCRWTGSLQREDARQAIGADAVWLVGIDPDDNAFRTVMARGELVTKILKAGY